MAKYALNPQTGKVTLCRAQKRSCPHVDQQHYDSEAEAHEAFEQQQEAALSPLKKPELPDFLQSQKDRFEKEGATVTVLENGELNGEQTSTLLISFGPEKSRFSSRDNPRKGFNYDRVALYGENNPYSPIASVDFSWMNESSINRIYGEDDNYVRDLKMYGTLVASEDEFSLRAKSEDPRNSGDDMYGLWVAAVEKSAQENLGFTEHDAYHRPDIWGMKIPDTIEEQEPIVKKYAQYCREEVEKYVAQKQHPIVVSHVSKDPEAALKVHIAAAKSLASRGLTLSAMASSYSEGNQTWENLAAKGNVTQRMLPNGFRKPTNVNVLDYRHEKRESSTSYAVNDHNGRVTVCSGDNCTHQHYSSEYEANNAYQASLPEGDTRRSEMPEWMKSDQEEAERLGGEKYVVKKFRYNGRNMIMTNTTELYDQRVSSRKGLKTIMMEVYDEANTSPIGSVQIGWLDEDQINKAYGPDSGDYMRDLRIYSNIVSDIGLPPQGEDPRQDREKMAQLWARVMNQGIASEIDKDAQGHPRRHDPSMAPESIVDMEIDMKKAAKNVHSVIANNYHNTQGIPSIMLSNISSRHRKTGLGKKMYIEAAKELGRQGKVLSEDRRATQSDDALAIWDSMMSNPEIKTDTLQGGARGELRVMNYRSSQ